MQSVFVCDQRSDPHNASPWVVLSLVCSADLLALGYSANHLALALADVVVAAAAAVAVAVAAVAAAAVVSVAGGVASHDHLKNHLVAVAARPALAKAAAVVDVGFPLEVLLEMQAKSAQLLTWFVPSHQLQQQTTVPSFCLSNKKLNLSNPPKKTTDLKKLNCW